MKIEELSAENKVKLIIAEQIVIFKEKGEFEPLKKRLDMLNLES